MPHAPKPPPAQRLSPAMKYLEEREIPLMPAMIVKIHKYSPNHSHLLVPEENVVSVVMRGEEEFRMTTSNDKHFSCQARHVEFAYPEPRLRLAIYKDYRTGQKVARQIHENYIYSQSPHEL